MARRRTTAKRTRRAASRVYGAARRRAPAAQKVAGFALPFALGAVAGYLKLAPTLTAWAPAAAAVGYVAGIPVATEAGLGVILGQTVSGLMAGNGTGGVQGATGGFNV